MRRPFKKKQPPEKYVGEKKAVRRMMRWRQKGRMEACLKR